MNVIEANDLGKRYGSTWALRECTLTIPEGHVAALVGPNGAGKTTLLNLTVGLTDPSSGTISVLNGRRAGSLAALDGIAFVAQNAPLYKNLSAADQLHETRNLNRRFDQGYAERRLGELGIPLRQKVGKMSGGQQAQVALTLALARRPKLLVLDEPLANLDPLAREDFMATVMTAAAEDGVSVVLSSHVLAELERVADYFVLVSRGNIEVAGKVEDLLAAHRLLIGPASESARYARRCNVVHLSSTGAQVLLLVRRESTANPVPPGWDERAVTLEELTMAYLRESGAATSSGPTRGRGHESSAVTR
jgi:ABC-2 type transport system ATP-binding protein